VTGHDAAVWRPLYHIRKELRRANIGKSTATIAEVFAERWIAVTTSHIAYKAGGNVATPVGAGEGGLARARSYERV